MFSSGFDLKLEDCVAGALDKSKMALQTFPKEGDVVIDDQPVIGRTLEPDQWPG